MAKLTELWVMAIPYIHLDHRGWLSGAVVEPPAHGRGRAIVTHVGATHSMVEGSYDIGEKGGPGRVGPDPTGAPGRGEGQPVQPQADYIRTFSSEPVKVLADELQYQFYLARAREPAEIVIVNDADDLPVEALAKARLDAIADWRAHYGDRDLPFDVWEKQFPIDKQIAELAKAIAKKAQADAKVEREAAAKAAVTAPKDQVRDPAKLASDRVAKAMASLESAKQPAKAKEETSK